MGLFPTSIQAIPKQLFELDLFAQLKAILPEGCQVIFLGDGEVDEIDLQAALQSQGWHYICRAAKNTQLFEADEQMEDILKTLPEKLLLDEATNRQLWKAWQQGLSRRITLPENLPPLRMILICLSCLRQYRRYRWTDSPGG